MCNLALLNLNRFSTNTHGTSNSYRIFSTQQMLQAKCLSELLRLSAEGKSQFKNPFTYAVLFIYCGKKKRGET